jgi:hypothetical protein
MTTIRLSTPPTTRKPVVGSIGAAIAARRFFSVPLEKIVVAEARKL